jgi:hypothetical protein
MDGEQTRPRTWVVMLRDGPFEVEAESEDMAFLEAWKIATDGSLSLSELAIISSIVETKALMRHALTENILDQLERDGVIMREFVANGVEDGK